MAASKPISWLYSLNTSLLSLNNNFGTLTLVLGCFPLDIQPYHTMSDYSIIIIALPIHQLTDKTFRSPDVCKDFSSLPER